MMRGTPPPIKDAGTSTSTPSGRAPRAPRSPQTVLNTPQADKPEVEKPEPKPRPNSVTSSGPAGGGLDFLAEIRKGKELKTVTVGEKEELPPQPKDGLIGALSAALEANRLVVGGGLDQGEEDSDWD